MNWFLVLLFWNPVAQDYQIANGWAPLPMASYERCEERLAFAKRYLPDYVEDTKNKIWCIPATSKWEAMVIAKEMA